MPLNSLYKETLSEFEQVPVKIPTGSRRFAMLPIDVLRRKDLSASCKVVFAGLAMESYGSGRISISHQAIAAICGISRITALDSLARLREVGLIDKDGTPVNQVQPHRILHSRLVGAQAAAIAAGPEESLECPRCHRSCKQLLRVGYCRACRWQDKIRGIVREEMAVARIA